MKKVIKFGSHFLAIAAFAALMLVNVQIGTADTHAEVVEAKQIDIIITCGTRDADCFHYEDGQTTIDVDGGVEDIQFE